MMGVLTFLTHRTKETKSKQFYPLENHPYRSTIISCVDVRYPEVRRRRCSRTDNISLGRTARNTAGGTGPPAGHRTGGSACTKVHLHSDNPLQKKINFNSCVSSAAVGVFLNLRTI